MRAIDRGLPYVYVMAIGMDVSADSFEASIRAAPDAAGAALADFDVTVGAFADGVTTITLELSDTQTAALPSAGDADGLEEMVFDMLWTDRKRAESGTSVSDSVDCGGSGVSKKTQTTRTCREQQE